MDERSEIERDEPEHSGVQTDELLGQLVEAISPSIQHLASAIADYTVKLLEAIAQYDEEDPSHG